MSVILITVCVDLLMRILSFMRKCVDLFMQLGGFFDFEDFKNERKQIKFFQFDAFKKEETKDKLIKHATSTSTLFN